MPKLEQHETAILTSTSIRYPGGPFLIFKRYMNGVIVGEGGHCYVACYKARLRDSMGLYPIVGALDDHSHSGWIFPKIEPGEIALDPWLAELRRRQPLEWRKLLKTWLAQEPMVKVAIEDYSLDDLNVLRDQGWYIGRSLHVPLWRVYALVPARLWESERPIFDGQVRPVTRFGAIYNPEVHQLTWR